MLDPFKDLSEGAKAVGDLVSIATLLGSLASILPSIASGLTVIWLGIRIYESQTTQKLLGRKLPVAGDDQDIDHSVARTILPPPPKDKP